MTFDLAPVVGPPPLPPPEYPWQQPARVPSAAQKLRTAVREITTAMETPPFTEMFYWHWLAAPKALAGVYRYVSERCRSTNHWPRSDEIAAAMCTGWKTLATRRE